jgi:cytochrome c
MKLATMVGAAAVLAAAVSGAAAMAAPDAAKGKAAFEQCRNCHSLKPAEHRYGPSLSGIIGRKAGAIASFNYSKDYKETEVVWDQINLANYLMDPKKMFPSTKMSRKVKSLAIAQDIAAYLATNPQAK